MTAPVVDATNTSAETAQVLSHTVALPAGINNAGRLIKVLISYAIAGGLGGGPGGFMVWTWPGGWEPVDQDEQQQGGDNGFVCACYLTTGSEGFTGDGSDTIEVTSDLVSRSAHNTYSFTGAENPSTQLPEVTTSIAANSAPDPPANTPTGGPKDFTYIAVGASSLDDTFSAYSSGYSGGIFVNTGGANANHARCGSCYLQTTSSTTEDPGGFTDPDSATAEVVSATIAIHPAGGAPPAGQPFMVRTQGVPTSAGRRDRPARWN